MPPPITQTSTVKSLCKEGRGAAALALATKYERTGEVDFTLGCLTFQAA